MIDDGPNESVVIGQEVIVQPLCIWIGLHQAEAQNGHQPRLALHAGVILSQFFETITFFFFQGIVDVFSCYVEAQE